MSRHHPTRRALMTGIGAAALPGSVSANSSRFRPDILVVPRSRRDLSLSLSHKTLRRRL